MLEIEFWSDLQCPWSHVAAIRLRRALTQFESPARVHWRYWPLELVNRSAPSRCTIETERPVLAQLEPDAFAPWTRMDYPDSFLAAMTMLKCAGLQSPEAADRFDTILRYAFFRDTCNLARVDVLLHLAEQAGVDVPRLGADYWGGRGAALLWQDWQESHQRAIQGSPHLFALGTDCHVHNPGITSHDSVHGIPIIDSDDPAFIGRWLREAAAAAPSPSP
ncbi:MAG TPA: DsbA family protein [Chloroflexia bacterium]|nr:DsbA family protein [Chloroflexia bacterium]